MAGAGDAGLRVKVAVVAVLALLATINSASQSSAFIYNLSYACEEGCLQGTGVVWNVTLHKGIGETLQITQIDIATNERDTGGLLAFYNASPVRIYTKENFIMKGKLPVFDKAAKATSLNVFPCFTTLLELKDTMVEDVFIGTERTYCEKANHSVQLYQCLEPAHCAGAEACVNNTCEEVSCGPCQYASNHSCQGYECCEASQCGDGQECIGNRCASLECTPGFKARNHTCAEIACSGTDVLVNNSCEALECSENETAANHSCTPLKCGIYETPKEHACAKIRFDVELNKDGNNGNSSDKTSVSETVVEIGGLRLSAGLSRLLETALLAAILALAILFANAANRRENLKWSVCKKS